MKNEQNKTCTKQELEQELEKYSILGNLVKAVAEYKEQECDLDFQLREVLQHGQKTKTQS